jgi:hypothetical protein
MSVLRGHVLGYLVRMLRAMRGRGATVRELVRALSERGLHEVDAVLYLARAFKTPAPRILPFMEMYPPDAPAPAPVLLEERVGKLIDASRAEWSSERFPELMRLRDYLSFLELSKQHGVIINVCGANPWAGAHIGQTGYRCYDGRPYVVSRETAPHIGVVAADPADARLAAALVKYVPQLSYQEYLRRLHDDGLRVLGPDDGHALVDTEGRLLFEPYRLHGVYDKASLDPAWIGRSGEQLRGDFNRRLGAELILFGPHDDWELRNSRESAGPLCGPQPPVVQFDPDGTIANFSNLREVATRCTPYQRRWTKLYPDYAVAPKGPGV